jgi:predicted nucleic acid-binding protein
MYLIDTNILLEILLKQPQAVSARRFLNSAQPQTLYLSDFALYSIGIRLIRIKRSETYNRLVNDLVVSGGVQVIRLEPADLSALTRAAKKYRLDFDDAYQYVLAEKHDLIIISFDAHFDSTPRGRKRPADILPSNK